MFKPISCKHADRSANAIYGKMRYYDAHGDVIFLKIWEKYKKHKNKIDSNANIF